MLGNTKRCFPTPHRGLITFIGFLETRWRKDYCHEKLQNYSEKRDSTKGKIPKIITSPVQAACWVLIKLQSHTEELAEDLNPSVHVSSAWHQQLPGPAAYTRNRMQGTGKYNSSRLDVTNTLWAGMLYSISICPSMKIMGKCREIEKRLTEFIFFERNIGRNSLLVQGETERNKIHFPKCAQ